MFRPSIGLIAIAFFALSILPARANSPGYTKMEICNRGDIDVNVMFARNSTSMWNDKASFGWIPLRQGRCEQILDLLRQNMILGSGYNQTNGLIFGFISMDGLMPVWLDKNNGEFLYETGFFNYDSGGTQRHNEGGYLCAPDDLHRPFAIEFSGWGKNDSCGRNNIRVPASNSITAIPNKAYTEATITIKPKKSNRITFDGNKYQDPSQQVQDASRPSVNPSKDTFEQNIKDLEATVGAIGVFCAMFNCKKGLESLSKIGIVKKKHTYPGNIVYEGDWQNGEPNGIGTMTFPDGSIHTGQWKNGVLHGKVSIKTPESIYTGDFRNGKANGWGQFIWGTETLYEGEFKDGSRHGQGKVVLANGDTYVGDFRFDKKHGLGTYTWAAGDVYTGAWVENEHNGKGFYKFANGTTYDGYWRASTQHGFGVQSYVNGSKFSGYFDQGTVNGSGELTLKTGERCQGQWRDNKLHGQGIGWDTDGTRKPCTTKGLMQFKLN